MRRGVCVPLGQVLNVVEPLWKRKVNKNMNKILVILFLISAISKAEIHYVSKTGNPTPPYTSWETAADTIQNALDISLPGDTVYVGEGVFEEKITLPDSIALIGSGMEKSVIDYSNFPVTTSHQLVSMNNYNIIAGFTLVVSSEETQIGIGIYSLSNIDTSIVKDNYIKYCQTGIRSTSSLMIMKNNILFSENFYRTFRLTQYFFFEFYSVIENNLIVSTNSFNYLVFAMMDARFNLYNNIFVLESGYMLYGLDHNGGSNPLDIRNNLFISLGDEQYNPAGLLMPGGYYTIMNNTFYGHFDDDWGAITANTYNTKVMNNLLLNTGYGIKNYHPDTQIQYNNVWGAHTPFFGDYGVDSTNITLDPMVVNPEQRDFHLQKYSPMIDAGNPEITDKDGTRSDIGMYGGPLGEVYSYRNLPPKPPVIINNSFNENTGEIFLEWKKNTEADISHYNIYEMVSADLETTRIIRKLPVKDTLFTGFPLRDARNYYYTVTAVDKEGYESRSYQGIQFERKLTGVKEPNIVYQYYLAQNYPNPFNPETTIEYSMKEPGNAQVVVYDIKGSKIAELEDSHKEKGIHSVKFNANDYNLSSGIYIYRIDILNEENHLVYSAMKKMILIK